jgi:hypothetical protein
MVFAGMDRIITEFQTFQKFQSFKPIERRSTVYDDGKRVQPPKKKFQENRCHDIQITGEGDSRVENGNHTRTN